MSTPHGIWINLCVSAVSVDRSELLGVKACGEGNLCNPILLLVSNTALFIGSLLLSCMVAQGIAPRLGKI